MGVPEIRRSRAGRSEDCTHDAKPLRLCALRVSFVLSAVCVLRHFGLTRRAAETQRASRCRKALRRGVALREVLREVWREVCGDG